MNRLTGWVHRTRSLKKRILLFMILCWVVPIAVFFAFTTISYRESIIEKSESVMEDELQSVASFAAIRIDDAISLCQKPSYEKTWENYWREYTKGHLSKSELVQAVDSSLRGKFYLDKRFNRYAFYLYGNEQPACYSSRIGAAYTEYVTTIQPKIMDIIRMDSSYTYVKVVDSRVYIVRNLYTTTDYTKYGTLVVEMDKSSIFQDTSSNLRDNIVVCIGSSEERLNYEAVIGEDEQKEKLVNSLLASYDSGQKKNLIRQNNNTYNGYLFEEQYDNYHIGIVMLMETRELYSSLFDLYRIVLVMILMFIPLITYGITFLRKEIQAPIGRLMSASQKMENGEFGLEIKEEKMPNTEFAYLMESFNRMSLQVKYLFDSVYNEKLARKDAQILALQAQINPHFLNNTLEMMNWQARMSGDIVVSKMIESLSTVLDFRMNRSNVKKVHLSEELQCTDAYFYIMSMRFGQRLQVEKQIDDDLLYITVPPLILQPIVENAIVHGVEQLKNGTIHLKVYHDDENIYLEVSNSSKPLKEEAMRRIQGILAGNLEQVPKQQGHHTSIGIYNVNQRIKLVYGDEYGLNVSQREDGMVVSAITIPYDKSDNSQQEQEKKDAWDELKVLKK